MSSLLPVVSLQSTKLPQREKKDLDRTKESLCILPVFADGLMKNRAISANTAPRWGFFTVIHSTGANFVCVNTTFHRVVTLLFLITSILHMIYEESLDL
jgi:hypothetical protein